MSVATHGLRILLGVIFVVFGLNGFLNFIPVPDFHPFVGILVESGYMYLIKVVEVAGGALLVTNRFVPLGLTLLTPVVVNIAAYHALLDARNGGVGLVLVLITAALLWTYRSAFAPLLESRRRPVSRKG